MIVEQEEPGRTRRELRRAGRWIVGIFWLVQFVELSLASLGDGFNVAARGIPPRLVVLSVGLILSLVFVEIVARMPRWAFRRRLIATISWAVLLCSLLVVVNFYVFCAVYSRAKVPFDPAEYVYTALAWSWFFIAISGALLSLSYNMESSERERRLSAMETKANEAQLAALRYQLNPHFLFNTLNSVASLVGQRDNETAERMVENLADFLRATLELEPLADITLAEEVELQRMYLSIEEQRFPDRLIARIDLAGEVARALVPALITQPLVENAIRHAVARSTAAVTVSVSAEAAEGQLLLVVEDDGDPVRAAPSRGTGVGLRNVESRLVERFGNRQAVTTMSKESGGFRVELRLPLIYASDHTRSVSARHLLENGGSS